MHYYNKVCSQSMHSHLLLYNTCKVILFNCLLYLFSLFYSFYCKFCKWWTDFVKLRCLICRIVNVYKNFIRTNVFYWQYFRVQKKLVWRHSVSVVLWVILCLPYFWIKKCKRHLQLLSTSRDLPNALCSVRMTWEECERVVSNLSIPLRDLLSSFS